MDMTKIDKCNMGNCAYNKEGVCHTLAISVGPHAECNTYVHASSRGGFNDVNGGIGSCLASDCKFNDRLECRASNIEVSGHVKHADCETFEKK
jgi:hypothetical protein